MKRLVGLIALLITTGAFAQTAPPKAAKKPPVQIKPQALMGCKLVGMVKGTKIWAGDCAAAADLRGSAPAAEPTAPAEPPEAPAKQ
ncbi:hypothetical protein FXB40_12705 [Bradyrhizobium rifense]|uniref:Uncharacterized protein n=1 Tax=Bradyrhizobium rifense TaxID=515499 RepID=A0A5D3KU59_9BRAD|nr:hypothetical protein [Bradyrhizobium rifense]TYL96166.1 hypothetical protein FXB40_12705 [Bradyrhizobium rifense]